MGSDVSPACFVVALERQLLCSNYRAESSTGGISPLLLGVRNVVHFTVFFLRFASNLCYFFFSFSKDDLLHDGYNSEYLTSFISPVVMTRKKRAKHSNTLYSSIFDI